MPKNSMRAASLTAAMFGNVEKGIAGVVIHSVFCIALGLLTARAKIFGTCSPFGIAAVAAASPKDSFFILFGAMVGYLLPGGPDNAIAYVAAAAAVLVCKFVLSGFEELAAKKAFVPSLAGIPCAVIGFVLIAAGRNTPYDILVFLIETLLCACSAVFFENAWLYLKKPSGLWGLSQHQIISVTISVCILLLALEGVQLSGISLGRILAVVLIICAARYGRETGGAIMGISAGMILSLAGGNITPMIVGYGFGGLIAGVFSPLGKVWCVVAFALANAVAQMTGGSNATMTLTVTYEVIVASFIYFVIPEKFLCRFSGLFAPTAPSNEKKVREDIYNKLLKSAETLDEISDMVSEVRKKLKHNEPDDIAGVFETASDSVCKKCGMWMYCWGTVYTDTMNSMNDVTETLRHNSEITRDDLPKHFVARCCKLTDFLAAVNSGYSLMQAKKASEIKAEQLRMITAPSLSNTASLIRDFAADISGTKQEFDGSERVRAALAACGLHATSSQLYIDARGRLTIEADIEGRSAHVSREKLLATLKATCGRPLEGPKLMQEENGENIKMCFTQKPQFAVRFGEAVIQKTGETLCGDACDSFVDEQGRAMLILSDGMGCGGKAAVDSNLTIGLMSRLLRCGFGFDEAAKIVSTAMMVKSSDESFSTLDIACIDLYDGSATFLKAGAPATYVRRCGRVERVEPSSMPIGIIPDVRLEKVKTKLRSGDLVVVVSDGAVPEDDSFIIKEMADFKGEPRSFAKQLAEKAKGLRSDGHDDDITVLAAAIM